MVGTVTGLELAMDKTFVELGIGLDEYSGTISHLDKLKQKDIHSYEHSILVGLFMVRMARHLKIKPDSFWYGGLLHDIGKINVPDEVLKKTSTPGSIFTNNDRDIMSKHPIYTREIIYGSHPFTGDYAYYHHDPSLQPNGYTLPSIELSKARANHVFFHAFFLSLADCYVSCVTNNNSRYGKGRPLTCEEALPVILKERPDTRQQFWANNFFINHVFDNPEIVYSERK